MKANPKKSKESMHVLKHMKELRTHNEAGRLGHEGGSDEKEDHSLEPGSERSPAMEKEAKREGEAGEHVKEGSHLDHPRVHAIKQHKLVNDTAYFLHHPQIKPHGPSMPPKKPKGC